MSGTPAGGLKAAAAIKFKYGEDFYRKIGGVGGTKSKNGGYWYYKYVKDDVDFVKEQGRKGGTKSSRKGVRNGESHK